MKKKILIGVAVVLVVLFGLAAMKPSEYTVARSAVMEAPAPKIFNIVNDLHHWGAWSPWAKLDPNAKVTIDGAPSGVGANYAWSGNGKVGEGKMTIVKSEPSTLVQMDLEFVKPMPGMSLVSFAFIPEGTGTRVTWKMSGHNNIFARVMCLFMDMDKMLGGQFDEGLAALKKLAETT